jgi:hypothetical protein
MTKNSIFRKAYARRQSLLHTGYDYKDKIMKNTLSSQLFGVNETLDTFLENINEVVYENVEAVKQIKIFANPALEKYEKNIK